MILGYKLARQRLYIYFVFRSLSKIKLKLSFKHEGKYLFSQQQFARATKIWTTQGADQNSHFLGEPVCYIINCFILQDNSISH